MDSKEMYNQAYRAHYYGKNLNYALNGYLKVIACFPDSDEARYSKQQILNIKKVIPENDIDLDDELKRIYNNICFEQSAKVQKEREILEENIKAQEIKSQKLKEFETNFSNLLLTTSNNFDGYIVKDYIDILCEEVVFKNSFWKRLDATFEDLGNAFTFKDTELSGANKLISNAREYVVEKFKRKAVQLGANAVLGVEFESSFGSDIVRVSVSGTAVRIEKIDNTNNSLDF